MHVPPGRTLSQNDWPENLETNPVTFKPEIPYGRASLNPYHPLILLGSLTLLLSAQVPLPNKVSCFISSDNSFLSIKKETTLWSWKGSPLLQQC